MVGELPSPLGLGSIPVFNVACGFSLLLVLVLAPRVHSGSSRFPLSTKTNIPKCNSTNKAGKEERPRGMFISKFYIVIITIMKYRSDCFKKISLS